MNRNPAAQPETSYAVAADSTERSADAVVRLVNVYKSFGDIHVLRGVDLVCPRGETTVVMGPSGCGKSVMLKHIAGLLKPDKGEVWFEETRIDTLREHELGPIRKQIGFLFQQGALFDSMNVGENIAFPLIEHTSMTRSQTRERVEESLGLVGLADSHDQMPAELSGGQRKRVALARAIVLRPKVVLFDEPTTGLDPVRADVINELILKLKQSLNMTNIVVTHDLTSAFKVADSILMLYDGDVLIHDTPDRVRNAPDKMVQHFLQGKALPDELAGIADSSDDGEA